MSQHSTRGAGRAVVIGASVAGLMSAATLADQFEQVVVVEKDTLPPPGQHRKSVPHGRHVHVLLERGRGIMERRLPGLTADLLELGARDIRDASRSILWYHTGFHKSGTSDVRGVAITRPKLEATIRSRVLAHPRVSAMGATRVLGLETDGAARVTGVRVVPAGEDQPVRTMTADLVIDAGGRGSRTPEWLADLGFAGPVEEAVRIGLGYTSYLFPRRPHHLPGLEGIIYLTTRSRTRFGVAVAQEDERWMVTLGGYLGAHAPEDMPGFREFAGRLPTPHIYDLVKDEDPLTPAATYKFPTNLRRHYEKLSRFPERYVVVGDALCSFNPVYGQGMTVAALEADALDHCLARARERLGPRFFAAAAKVIDVPWNTTVGGDLRIPEIEGRRTLPIRLINWYLDHLQAAAHCDAEVSIAFLRVINMLRPPSSILHPRIIWRVLKQRLRRSATG